MDSQIDECLLDTAFEQLKLNSTSVERDSSSKPVEIEKLLGDFQQAVNAPDDQEEKLTEALNRLLTGIVLTSCSFAVCRIKQIPRVSWMHPLTMKRLIQ